MQILMDSLGETIRIRPDIDFVYDEQAHSDRCACTDTHVLYINMRSIINKWNDFESNLQRMKIKPDIIVIAETWLRQHESCFYNLNDYHAFHCTRPSTTRGGGTSIFVRNIPKMQASCAENIHFNDCTILVIKLHRMNLHIIGVYRPDQTSIALFNNEYGRLLGKYKRTICVGDFNLNIRNEMEANVSSYVDTTVGNGFVLLNSTDVMAGTRGSSIIDHVSTDMINTRYILALTDFSLSDHKKIILTIKHNAIMHRPDTHKMEVVDYGSLDQSLLWNFVESAESLDELSQDLERLINENRKTVTKTSKRADKPWLTTVILRLIEMREFYFGYHRRFPTNIHLRDLYQQYKRLAKSALKNAKKEYFDVKFSDSVSCPRKLWSSINELMYNRVAVRQPTCTTINHNNILVSEPQDVCDVFNNYFIQTSHDLYSPDEINERYLNSLHIPANTIVRLQNATEEDVARAIDSLKSGAATGIDGISAKMLKRYKGRLVTPITNCINKSIQEGVYPESLKCASIAPILKSGDPLLCANYRPISVLCSLNMVYEEILRKWINDLFAANNTIHPHQYGFIKNSNTETAILHLTQFLGKAIQDGFYTAVLFLDLKKAFDSVDHRIIMRKLQKMGLAANELSLISTYLGNRRQLVKMGAYRSTLRNAISIAVPQGSKLGPILFNFSINDIHDLELNGEIQQFADDTLVKYKATSLDELQRAMAHDIDMLRTFLEDNHLYINTAKTKYMFFSKSERGAKHINESSINLQWAGQHIERVRSMKYLGIIIDDKLCWDKQISKIRAEITPYVFALRKMRPFITAKTAGLIYNAYIVSKLVYVSPAWRTATQYNLQKLRVLQHSALKSIHRVPWLTPSHLLFTPQFLSIDNMFRHRLLMYIHKVRSNEIRHSFHLQSAADVHDHDTRNKDKYVVGRRGGRAEEANVLLHGLALYNQLPPALKNLPTESFKKLLRVHLSVGL